MVGYTSRSLNCETERHRGDLSERWPASPTSLAAPRLGRMAVANVREPARQLIEHPCLTLLTVPQPFDLAPYPTPLVKVHPSRGELSRGEAATR